MDDLYWCREGCGFVDKDHRCEQWCHIYCIPGEARARIRAEARAEALREARKKIQALSDNLGSGDGMMTDKDRAMEDAFDLVFEILADEPKEERGAEGPELGDVIGYIITSRERGREIAAEVYDGLLPTDLDIVVLMRRAEVEAIISRGGI